MARCSPPERYVLAGLSRQTVIEIARTLAIPLREADIDLYDAYVAEEAFITSTSWCLVPVRLDQWPADRQRQVPGTNHEATDRRLQVTPRRLRLCRAISAACELRAVG